MVKPLTFSGLGCLPVGILDAAIEPADSTEESLGETSAQPVALLQELSKFEELSTIFCTSLKAFFMLLFGNISIVSLIKSFTSSKFSSMLLRFVFSSAIGVGVTGMTNLSPFHRTNNLSLFGIF